MKHGKGLQMRGSKKPRLNTNRKKNKGFDKSRDYSKRKCKERKGLIVDKNTDYWRRNVVTY